MILIAASYHGRGNTGGRGKAFGKVLEPRLFYVRDTSFLNKEGTIKVTSISLAEKGRSLDPQDP